MQFSTLQLSYTNNVRLFKINNTKHLLHDAIYNKLIITTTGEVLSAFWSNNGAISGIISGINNGINNGAISGISHDISIFIINRTINKYIFFGKEISYKYVVAIARSGILLEYSEGESGAELFYKLYHKKYEIYVMPDQLKSFSQISFKAIYSFPEWSGKNNCDFYVILYYEYILKRDFVKEIERLVLKESNSCYISADKKCIFVNKRKPEIIKGVQLVCNDIVPYDKRKGYLNKFVEGLFINKIYVANDAYLPSIKNLSYPGITIATNKQLDGYITIINEYLHTNFLFEIYGLGNIKIRIYEFKEYQQNITSRMMDNIIPNELIETDRFLEYVINPGHELRIYEGPPIAFLQKT
jgi:hypothetical protein